MPIQVEKHSIFGFQNFYFSGNRIWVTEFDIQPYGYEKYGIIDMDFKAEDLEDFMRQAFSHSKIDGIIAWKWLWNPEWFQFTR